MKLAFAFLPFRLIVISLYVYHFRHISTVYSSAYVHISLSSYLRVSLSSYLYIYISFAAQVFYNYELDPIEWRRRRRETNTTDCIILTQFYPVVYQKRGQTCPTPTQDSVKWNECSRMTKCAILTKFNPAVLPKRGHICPTPFNIGMGMKAEGPIASS